MTSPAVRVTSPEIEEIRGMATPLVDRGDLDPLLDRIGDARYVLLDAAHQAFRCDARGNWVPTAMGGRYDAFISFDATDAITPLQAEAPAPGAEHETAPWNT